MRRRAGGRAGGRFQILLLGDLGGGKGLTLSRRELRPPLPFPSLPPPPPPPPFAASVLKQAGAYHDEVLDWLNLRNDGYMKLSHGVEGSSTQGNKGSSVPPPRSAGPSSRAGGGAAASAGDEEGGSAEGAEEGGSDEL